ncbi:MAG: DEAD/DEAH box helicase [Verrucomicrobia bacterium]|nr:DEAD/DEAH box helicase [Verrucomicrobiota bacterium]
MLRKLFAKIRKTIGAESKPEKSKPAPSHTHSQPRAASAQGKKPYKPRATQERQEPQGGPRGPKQGGQSQGGHSAGSHSKPRQSGHSGQPSSRGPGGPRSHPRREEPARSLQPRYEPELTPQSAYAPPADVPKMDTAFTKLGLNDQLAFAVQAMGYAEPTPIQQQAIPVVLAGRDVIGSAQTGTGKTAAFALPILQLLAGHGKLRCLILEPTRELALQVEEAFKKFSKFTDLRVTVVYGGVGYGKQRDDLHRGVDVLAATPGRLLDHMEQGDVRLDNVDILVLDEVDRMLDMGFLPDVKRIVQKCPKERQTLFFTATMPPELASLAGWALREPVEIKIGQRRSPAETIAHAFYPVVESQKFELLEMLLDRTDYKSVIIFSRTKFGADRIARRLQKDHLVGVIHSDRSQRERVEALEGFKSGKFEVLVATDIAARGLDIAGVSHVINYDVPENPEDYVHRIGRTGRAQASGDAFTLVTEDNVRDARSIERFIGAPIERKKIEGFPYIYSALFDEKALADTVAASAKPVSRLHRGARR